MRNLIVLTALVLALPAFAAELPGPTPDGYFLPNGWTITPMGKTVACGDLPLNISPAPDGKAVVALHGGYNAHGLVVLDPRKKEASQQIILPTAWLGLAWSPDGKKLYVSGGNSESNRKVRAPIYVFDYADGRLSDKPVAEWTEPIDYKQIFWSGLVHHPSRDVLYAASRTKGEIVVFDTAKGEITAHIPVEVNPYDLVLTPDGATLYCSNWASDTVSVIDTVSNAVVATIPAGDNPSDMVLTRDGRLFVCCANDNAVVVIDTAERRAVQRIMTAMYPKAPEGSTPNALALDADEETLFVANADNNNICVVEMEEPGESTVLGYLPVGWYPSAVCFADKGDLLYVGNAKGETSSSNIRGPRSPLPGGKEGTGTTKSLMKGTISIINIEKELKRLPKLTKQAYKNSPYNDDLLNEARPPKSGPSVVPSKVGAGSPIKHVIYIIKENRTYDQVLGDMPQGNGDPRICIFGRDITPNHHAIAEQFVLLDNLYCDAEVSQDGHQWSNAAYATDWTEKNWPADYAGKITSPRSAAVLPGAGYIWDMCAKKGLTYRSYGEFARRQSQTEPAMPSQGISGLEGHVAPLYMSWGARDTDNAKEFIREFDEYEKNFDSTDPEKRLPNFIVMSLPEDHTHGTTAGIPSPRACVASNDFALGMILERISNSRYWPELALFVIEDDAQDGPDHVDAHRTVGLVASPYCKRGAVDSTFYTTSSFLRTMELLLGMPPMSQFDAAANPMYASFADKPDPTPYTKTAASAFIDELNIATAWGAKESEEMDFSDYDRTPMFALNEIVWKSVKGADSEMPIPISRFHAASVK